jgi:anti-anti-sigma factor
MAFNVSMEAAGDTVKVRLEGELDASSAGQFKQTIEQAAGKAPKKLVLFVDKLSFMASAGLRVLIFAKQKMGAGVDIYVIGATGPVLSTLQMSGFHHAVYLKDSYAD